MTLIIQDRFDGAAGTIEAWPGNVIGRTMDSGHVWYPGNEGDDLRLDGAGKVTGGWPPSSSYSDVWCNTQMPLADYWIELDVSIPANDLDSWFTIFYKIQTQPNPSYGSENSNWGNARWFPVNSTSAEVVEIGGEGALMGTLQATTRGAGTFGDCTFRVTVVGTLVSTYIDGVFVASKSIVGAIPNNGWVGFGMKSRNSDSSAVSFVRVREFRAGTIADYTPPLISAHSSAATPLGAPSVLGIYGETIYARSAAPSPLGAPSAVALAITAVWSKAPSMLGSPAALGLVPLFGHSAAPGPLGAAAVLATHDFTDVLGDATTRWVMDLITPTGTVRVPISSWQATLQSGSSSYVQCVIPACLAWVDAINAATEFVIYRRADVPGTALTIEYEMARSLAEQARFDQGPTRYTCTLSGYPDAFAASLDPPVAYDRTLAGVRSISSGSALRVRCAVDWLLRPGHRAYVGAAPLVVRYINYYAMDGDGYMDVGE